MRSLICAGFVAGGAGAKGLANKAHTGSCWKAGMVAVSRFTVSWDTAGWLTAALAGDQLPGSARAEARRKDAVSEAATLWAHGVGGHSWNGCSVSRTTAVLHGAGAALARKTPAPRGFYRPSRGVLARQRASFLVVVSPGLPADS